jgi:3-isopropylmalate/(R)-2-methylmalate dehydratase small subunit
VILEGKALVIEEDNVDTDVLYPGAYLSIDKPEEMKPYLFEGLDPSLRDGLDGPTVLVVGENFGGGSSREHVPHAMKASQIVCVLGKSFARIFYRNCINLGLPIIAHAEAAAAAKDGSEIRIDTDAGEITVEGKRYETAPVPEFMQSMLASGGLIPWSKERLEEKG